MCGDLLGIGGPIRLVRPTVAKWPHLISAPLEATLELTKACTLNCVYCYADAGTPHPNELTTSEWKDLVDQLADLQVFTVFLGGGEPLLRKDLFEIAQYATRRRLKVALSTNGTLLDENIVERLKRSDIEPIQISVDGPRNVHNLLRGGFDRTLKGIRLLKYNGVNFQISSTLTRHNYQQIPFLFKLAHEYMASALFLSSVMPSRKIHNKFSGLALKYEQEKVIVKYIKTLKSATSFYVLFIGRYVTSEDTRGFIKEFSKSDKQYVGCGAGVFKCTIDPIGNVYPCELARSPLTLSGNVRTKNFRDIWLNSPTLKTIRNFVGKRICRTCNLLEREVKNAKP